MNQHTWWYVSRASGVVAWGLLTSAVVLGLWLSLRLTKQRPRPAWTLDLHRFLGGLAVVFTGVHLAGLVADSYVHFGAEELFVPFASTWKPGAVTWGIVGLYLLLAIELTSLGMRFLPRKLWRGVHLTSYLLFAVATVHMFAAGTDAGRRPLEWAGVAGVGVVGFLTLARMLATDRRGSSARSSQGRGTAEARARLATARASAGAPASAGARATAATATPGAHAAPAASGATMTALSWRPGEAGSG